MWWMCPAPWSKLRVSIRNVACASSHVSMPCPIIYFVQFSSVHWVSFHFFDHHIQSSVQFYCECTGLWCGMAWHGVVRNGSGEGLLGCRGVLGTPSNAPFATVVASQCQGRARASAILTPKTDSVMHALQVLQNGAGCQAGALPGHPGPDRGTRAW